MKNDKKPSYGFDNCENQKQKSDGKKQTVRHENFSPPKQSKQVEVTQADFGAMVLGVDGKELQVPVIYAAVPLAEVELFANIEAYIKLPTSAKEIKQVRKNVYFTQCRALPSLLGIDYVNLSITGFIHKNIHYTDRSGYVRDVGVDVPFSCNQTVELINRRDPSITSLKNTVLERSEIDQNKMGAGHPKHTQVNFEVFNEPIECKVLASFINEVDVLKKYDKRGYFNKITEKMELSIILKLLQNQQVVLFNKQYSDDCHLSVMERIQQLRENFER
ncbi:CsxC family protein [Halalkalibacter okhensis]|uniref:Uracil permease n=1 Tax=Halalkalibacter okhensis TaxID=333138 RepID=A0A0B0IEP0_9BACI|nr:hypothetical protein [Halalkalibacter okhensis]KHF38529.1 hypothetical protein LQ50_20900 [Halalkalibacter okhensis]